MAIISVAELLKIYKRHPYISTDSRRVMPSSLFFALKGDNYNGNVFVKDALKNGASYAITDDPEMVIDEGCVFLVDDVLDILQKLASLYRSELKIPVIAITGTNGKTTSKELISVSLSARYNVVATPGNFNNHIGVPLTLLSIKPDTEIVVVEMGANHVGEIAALCKIAQPTHGLITNIGRAHLEGFGSYLDIIKAKNELYEYLNIHGGRVFVNSSNDLLMKLSINSHRITFGSNIIDEIQGIVSMNGHFLNIKVIKPDKLIIETKLAGSYNFENVMSALCIAHHFRVDLNQAAAAISNYKPNMNRSQIIDTGLNTLILDAYNANPSSMRAAIENFALMEVQPKILILGDMFELGKESIKEHHDLINSIDFDYFDKIYTAGPIFKEVSKSNKAIFSFLSTEELKDELVKKKPMNTTILIKGSRGMKLEGIVDIL